MTNRDTWQSRTVWLATRLVAAAALLSIAVALAIGAFGSPELSQEFADNGPPCMFHLMTGLVCPLCGMTHATISLGSGDLVGALAAHPLAPLLLALIVWAAYRLATGRGVTLRGHRLRPLAAAACIALVWAINLVAHQI